jgi:hypothetical protein
MGDTEIGFVELSPTTRITFSVGSWKGRSRGSIRKFITSERYAGPTKSGMFLDGAILLQLLAALRSLQSTVPSPDQNQHISVGKIQGWEIRITIVPPDEKSDLPSIDIREFIEKPSYTGPTKAGVRFSWNKLKQFTQLVEVLVQRLGAAVSSEITLFPDIQPKWVADAKKSRNPAEHKVSSEVFDAASLKSFPDQFLSDANLDVEEIELPADELKISQDRNGSYFVTDESSFRKEVRNEVEAKFFVYAQLRGVTNLHVPKKMFEVFKAVAGYENFCRDLRNKLVHDLEKRSGNRTLAEHIARETFDTHGLPYV